MNSYEGKLLPSIEKPWLKYYSQDEINSTLPQCTMYEYICNNNKDHLDDVAMLYFGRKLTYREVFNAIDQTAAAFVQLGVKAGDVVTIQSLSLPQVIFSVYALNKIGAVANLVYANIKATELKSNLSETGSRILVIMEHLYDGIANDSVCKELDAVILLGIQDEMTFLKKAAFNIAMKAKKNKTEGHVFSWSAFFATGKGKETKIQGKNEDLAIMVYTGGTTGKSKGVMLSNFNMNVGAKQYMALGFKRNNTLLCVLPPFIAFGLTVTIHMPLSFGVRVALCISSDPTEISQFVTEYHPEYIICGTAQAEKMVKALDHKHIDLSNLTFFGVGGEALSAVLEENVNSFLHNHGSPTKIIQGYAMSETAASSTAAVSSIFKNGTVGIPFVHTVIKIVDTDTATELPYGAKGEICISAPCTMMGYWQNQEETNNVLRIHSDGQTWVHTGDLGTMDEDGFIKIVGRMKRIILTFENDVFHKVFPKLLEDGFLKTNMIQAISIVGKANERTTNDLIAFVVPNQDTDKTAVLQTLKEYADNHLETYERPTHYIVVDKLPLTTVGKVDYRALEQEAEKIN